MKSWSWKKAAKTASGRCAPLLAPAFRWNHGQVMAEGGRGLARHLGAKLLSTGAA